MDSCAFSFQHFRWARALRIPTCPPRHEPAKQVRQRPGRCCGGRAAVSPAAAQVERQCAPHSGRLQMSVGKVGSGSGEWYTTPHIHALRSA